MHYNGPAANICQFTITIYHLPFTTRCRFANLTGKSLCRAFGFRQLAQQLITFNLSIVPTENKEISPNNKCEVCCNYWAKATTKSSNAVNWIAL